MTVSVADIDRVVREVLAQMGISVRADGNGSANPASSKPARAADPTTLALTGRLVTLADLDGRLGGVKRIVVPADAIVTPAVVDELRRRRINLQRTTDSNTESPTVGPAPIALRVVSRRWDDGPLQNLLARDGVETATERSDCLIQSTDALADWVNNRGGVGVVLSTHPAMAQCLANRHAGVRAIVGRSLGQMTADADDVGANVLVADPSSVALFVLKQMIARFAHGGPRGCPESLQERLA